MNEQELCRKKLTDLSCQANRKGIVVFSDFLNLNEQNIYRQSERLFETRTESFGGVPFAERQMVAFIPDALSYEWEYPIAVLHISPVSPKFAEKLEHRDILGAVMQLGVERSKIGDILVGEGEAWLLCEARMADYFAEQLNRIRHTDIRLSRADAAGIAVRPNLEEHSGIVTSNRLDSVIACVYRLSRSKAQDLIRQDKVFINGKLTENPAYACREEEIVSVRGHGRFVFEGCLGKTGKGRMKITYKQYTGASI